MLASRVKPWGSILDCLYSSLKQYLSATVSSTLVAATASLLPKPLVEQSVDVVDGAAITNPKWGPDGGE